MTRRDLLFCNGTHLIDFSIECGWLHVYGYRLFDLTWELHFTVWNTTWPKPCMETTTRRNPRGTLRLRLANEGIFTDFFGDEFVQSLVAHVATVDLADLMDKMRMIALENPKYYSEPIVLLDGGLDS